MHIVILNRDNTNLGLLGLGSVRSVTVLELRRENITPLTVARAARAANSKNAPTPKSEISTRTVTSTATSVPRQAVAPFLPANIVRARQEAEAAT